MQILLFGGSGMLGTAIIKAAQEFGYGVFAPSHAVFDIVEIDFPHRSFINLDLIINAAGEIGKNIRSYSVNSKGALNVATLAKILEIPLIHISTDCVFSGKKNAVWNNIDDIPDPIDLYGVSKRYGEIAVGEVYPEASIIRTSFIGEKHGLLRWFLDLPDNAVVDGYSRAFWSGSTVDAVARKLLTEIPIEKGIQHLSIKQQILKYDLLVELANMFRKDITINKVREPYIARGLRPTLVLDDVYAALEELRK